MGRIEKLFNRRKAIIADDAALHMSEVLQGKEHAQKVYEGTVPKQSEALSELQGHLAPLFDELRYHPQTMFLLPSMNPLKIVMGKISLKTPENVSFSAKSPVMIASFGKSNSDHSRDTGPHASKYGKGGDQRVLISYDAENEKYIIQEQVYKAPPVAPNGDNTGIPMRSWRNAGRTDDLTKGGALRYMEERLVDVLAHHKRSIPGRVTKLAAAAACVFGLLSYAGDANASKFEGSEDLSMGDPQTEMMDAPTRDLPTHLPAHSDVPPEV